MSFLSVVCVCVCLREVVSDTLPCFKCQWHSDWPVCDSLCPTCPVPPSLPSSDFSYDLRPGQRNGANRQLDWNDAVAVSLGRLPAVPGAHAARLPCRLLGVQEQDGGEWVFAHTIRLSSDQELTIRPPHPPLKACKGNDFLLFFRKLIRVFAC